MATATAGEAPVADMLMNGKPACGSDGEVGEYDLGLHVLGLCKSSFIWTLIIIVLAWC